MIQFGVHPFREEGCTTCKKGVKGFVFIPDSWGRFEPVGTTEGDSK